MTCRLLKKLLITVSSSFILAFSLYAESTRSYDISVVIAEDGKSFTATQTTVFQPEFATKDIRFHVYWNGLLKGSELEKGAPVSFQEQLKKVAYTGVSLERIVLNGVDIQAEQFNDPSVFRITTPDGFKPGKKYSLTFTFSATIPQRLLRYGYHESDGITWISQWFPKIGVLRAENTWACEPARFYTEFFADFSDYMLTVKIPSNYSLVANMKTIASTTEGKTSTHTFAASRIHDCTFGFAPKFFISDGKWKTIPIRFVRSRPISASHADFIMKRTYSALEYFTEKIGPYPFEELTIVEFDSFGLDAGGMEYPSLIQITSRMSLMGRALDHELAHQWFYGVVGFNETDEPWLDEGLTSYYEFRLDTHRGKRVLGPIRYTNLDIAYLAYSRSKLRTTSSIAVNHGQDSRFHGYVKAPVVFSMLASLITEEKFDGIIQELVHTFSYRNPDSQEILAFFAARLEPQIYTAFEKSLTGKAFNYHVAHDKGVLRVDSTFADLPAQPLSIVYKDERNASTNGTTPQFTVEADSVRVAAVQVLDGDPADSYYHVPRILHVVLSLFIIILMGIALRMFSRRIQVQRRKGFVQFLSMTLFFMLPCVAAVSYVTGLFEDVQQLSLPFNGFVMLMPHVKQWLVPLFAGFGIFIIASLIRSTMHSIRMYAEADAAYSLLQIFFIDCASFLIIPLFIVVVITIGHFNILLFTLFLLLLAMAEPLKLLMLMPSKKAIIANNFKSIIMQSLLVNFFTLCAVLLILVVASQFIVSSVWVFVIVLCVMSSLEFVYRSLFLAIIQRLPQNV